MVEFDFGIIKRAKIGTAAGVEFYARVEGTTARGIKISLAHGAPFYISLDRARVIEGESAPARFDERIGWRMDVEHQSIIRF